MSETTTSKGGRPRWELDDVRFQKLRRMVSRMATAEECAAAFGIDEKTLTSRLKERGFSGFSEFFRKHNAGGKISLRRAQYITAVKDRNPTMLIWLGKQYLDQKDITQHRHVGADGGDIKHRLTLDHSKLTLDQKEAILEALTGDPDEDQPG